MAIVKATDCLLENFVGRFADDDGLQPSRFEPLKEITNHYSYPSGLNMNVATRKVLSRPLDKCLNLKNFDSQAHLAYWEYKNSGEYWKNTPKTDYTYSELSPYRRVLASKVVSMPNMSRQSLDDYRFKKVSALEKTEQVNVVSDEKSHSLVDFMNVALRARNKNERNDLIQKDKAVARSHFGIVLSALYTVFRCIKLLLPKWRK